MYSILDMPICPNCGNNPIPHLLSWFNESVTVAMTPINQLVFGNIAGKRFFGYSSKLFTPLGALFLKSGLATYRSEPSEQTSSRAKVLWEEAKQRGINMESFSFLGRENDSYRARVNGKTIYFTSLPRPEYMPKTAEWWIDDKAAVKERLLKHGLPAVPGGSFSRYRPLKKRFATLRKPVVIKPRLGSRGRHTTTFVYTEDQLKQAFKVAKQLCHWVIMEEQMFGNEYRATMVDGKLSGILRGNPPRITGDGTHTISELIDIKNANRHEKVKPVKVTPHLERFIARSGYTLATILPDGLMIDLLHNIGVSYGGYSAEETHLLHPETKAILEKAAQVISDPMIGLDFIIPDVSASPQTQRWGITEANGVPFINLHHDPVEGSRNVAAYVWDFVERNPQWY